MAGESAGKLRAAAAGGCLEMLKSLGKEEILEILSDGLCDHCNAALLKRIQILTERKLRDVSLSKDKATESSLEFASADSSSLVSPEKSIGFGTASRVPTRTAESALLQSPNQYTSDSSSASLNKKQSSFNPSDYEILLYDGLSQSSSVVDDPLSEEQKERIRFAQVSRKKDFTYIERVDGKPRNVLQGLELHARVFNTQEQRKIVECVYKLQRMGQKGQLSERTYSEPRKWMRGKGRVTMQFGCCYNYAVDKNGNPPGIIRDEEVDPLPPLFKQMIKRMVRWHVLPPSCIPNSCIVNIYDEGDCIPPHIDHHDFVRPFCTVSFLTECNILFGSNLKVLGPGEFDGPVAIPLPVGSVLILSGNGADVAKHCVPGVPAKRISITFRKMDDRKLPYNYARDPELLSIRPLTYSPSTKSVAREDRYGGKNRVLHEEPRTYSPSTPIKPFTYSPSTKSVAQEDRYGDKKRVVHEEPRLRGETRSKDERFPVVGKDDFPPLGRSSSGNRFKRSGFK